MTSYYNNNKRNHLIFSQKNNQINGAIKNKTPLRTRNKSNTFLKHTNTSQVKSTLNMFKNTNNDNMLKTKEFRYNSNTNIFNSLNYNKNLKKLYYNIKFIRQNNNNIGKILPTPELTGTTFDKKYELSKIISKIREKKQKGKMLKNNSNFNSNNILSLKKLSEKIKIIKKKKFLKQKYNNDEIFDYLKGDHSFNGTNKSRLSFNDNANSKNKLEKIKKYLSRNKNGNYLAFEENTIEKLSKMKTELKNIKFVRKIKI